MKVAVMTLCRDRLPYSQHCFQTLRDNAGCDFDWYVVDQGSTDGTAEWLEADESIDVTFMNENIGICPALNLLLDEAINAADYDVLVRFDNDCEVLSPDTLATCARLVYDHRAILAPKVQGLRNPPPTLSQFTLDGFAIDETSILGGIFMAIPASLFSQQHGFRYDEGFPPWAGDEAICQWWRNRGGRCGYLTAYPVNHYLTTDGQVSDIPWYFQRRVLEGGRAA